MAAQKKLRRLNVRLTEAQYASVKRCAEKACMPLSVYVRTRCLPEFDTRTKIEVSTPDLRKLLVSQKRATTLTNQVAHALNRGGRISLYERKIIEALEATTRAMDETTEFIVLARQSI